MSRRSFVSTAATGAAALAAMGTVNSVEGQLVYTQSDWKVSEFNQLAKNPAQVKQVYDVTHIAEGSFLNNIKNSLNGLHFGFGIPNEQIKIVAALHGPANMLNYDDFIWNKYKIGAWLKISDLSTNQPALKNPYYASKAGPALHYSTEDPDSRDSIYQDTSIQALQHRGVKLLSCHTAAEEQVRGLIAHQNLTQQPELIVKEMLAHTLPEVLVVASMVAAIALLQTDGRYSYITVSDGREENAMPKVQKTPPWSKGANDPAMSESCEFLAPDIDNVPDLHGNPADAELELFIGGNQPQLIAGFQALHPN